MNASSRFALVAAVAALLLAGAARAQPSNLEALHAALHLSPAQENAWRAFVAGSEPSADEGARNRAAQSMLPSLRAPQRVDLTIDVMEDNLASMKAHGAALKAFYAQLSLDQQRIFDRETQSRDDREP